MDADSETLDKRDVTRHRTLKAGLVVFNDGRSTFDCVIKNISVGGAKLAFNRVPVMLPEQFALRMADGVQRDCSVRWRKALEMGVEFAPEPLSNEA